jgi:hypothetical protein
VSTWLDHAEYLATRLREEVPWCLASVPAATRVPVLVDRKLDILSICNQTAAKAGGAAVVVSWMGARNAEPASRRLRTTTEYSIACMTTPTMRDGQMTCDELTEAAAVALHGWSPPGSPCQRSLVVSDITLVPDRQLLIYEISAELPRLPILNPGT